MSQEWGVDAATPTNIDMDLDNFSMKKQNNKSLQDYFKNLSKIEIAGFIIDEAESANINEKHALIDLYAGISTQKESELFWGHDKTNAVITGRIIDRSMRRIMKRHSQNPLEYFSQLSTYEVISRLKIPPQSEPLDKIVTEPISTFAKMMRNGSEDPEDVIWMIEPCKISIRNQIKVFNKLISEFNEKFGKSEPNFEHSMKEHQDKL